jgi:hypothetical protein
VEEGMSNILIVTHWFYPRQNPRAFRGFELYRELSKEHKVDVLIGDWKFLLKSGEDYHVLDCYSAQEIANRNAKLSNKKLIQTGIKVVQFFIGDRYLLSGGKFLYQSINLENYDAVISIGLPFYVHWITSKKIRNYKGNIISISDWGDPFDKDQGKKIANYFTKIQKRICNTFDYVVTPTKNALSYYEKYKDNKKNIRVIPQGFDFSEVEIADYRPNRIPHFAYAGIFYHDKRNPEKFLDFLSEVEDDFVFTIYTIKHGPMYQNILLKYKKLLKEKLVIKDMVPRLECIRLLSENDFLINIDNVVNVQVPSKLIDYTLSGRPILSFKQDEIPNDKFYEFISSNYSQKYLINVDDYNITSVASKFNSLILGG